ncbi:PHP domain-containing protein [Dehalobacter sp. DCM]|uniref:PHP domain-containing protein n=1 Tax=Dehalobacter sp. DCM TaxID=2907827 RepID=UPI0030818C7D|nr:PHP domain-containing protein [Dehalobacter sp. DCM]
MPSLKADLHVHTNESDGSLGVEETIRISLEKGLDILAITDHETTAGVEKAQILAKDTGLKIIPGFELSTYYKDQEIHLLGYYKDIENNRLQDKLNTLRNERTAITRHMVEKLNTMGLNVTWRAIEESASLNGVVSKSHIFYALWNNDTYNNRVNWEDLALWLKPGGMAYVPYEGNPFPEAVDFIYKTGGFPVLAHPGLIVDQTVIKDLLDYRPIGIEVYYGYWHDRDEKVAFYEKLAQRYGYMSTGGSDYHGFFSHIGIGDVLVPDTCIQTLKEYLEIDE